MAVRTVVSDEVPEESTPLLTFQIVDRDGVGFQPDVFILTLYDNKTGDILNGRDEQNVLNANGCTVDADGNVEFTMEPEDTTILDTASALEVHIALFEWTWNAGLFHGKHEIQHKIRNMSQVPS